MNDDQNYELKVPWGKETKFILISIVLAIVGAVILGFILGHIGLGSIKTDEGKPVEIVVQ